MALFVTPGVGVRGLKGHGVKGHGSCDGKAERLGEQQGEDQPYPCPGEGLDPRNSVRLVDCIIRRKTRPARGETEDGSCKGQDAAGFGAAGFHGNVDEGARMGELAEHNEKDDEGRNPTVEFVVMDDFVAEDGDKEGRSRDDDDTSEARKIIVDRVEKLRADNDVDTGPADACEDVEDGDCGPRSVL